MACDLILALDVPTRAAAAPILRQLRGQLRWVKIGLQIRAKKVPKTVRKKASQFKCLFNQEPYIFFKKATGLLLSLFSFGGQSTLSVGRGGAVFSEEVTLGEGQ